jgi:esterase/lipase
MADYLALKSVLEHDIPLSESSAPLISDPCRTQLLLHDQPTSKVCLFFHGFTAGPYQFVPIGQTLHKAGYNVLIPLLPGHGQVGTWTPTNPPPLADDPHIYLKFALKWLTLAQSLGQKVVIGGLSGGGTLAAWLALEQADKIDRALLFAPYFSASSKVIDLFVRHIDTYVQWEKLIGPSYPGFHVDALRAVLKISDYCAKRVRKAPVAPTFMISSESDKAVDNNDHRQFFDNALKNQPLSWYHCFDRVLDIPHTMMTTVEGNRHTNLLNIMAKAFIESNLTWAEIEEIAYRMTKGRTFNAAINELGWQDKASPDMPAMLTLIDKWSIVVKRQLGNRPTRKDQ